MIFDKLSNAACCLSLGGPGAELEGGGVFKHPPPPARRGWRRAPARRGLSLQHPDEAGGVDPETLPKKVWRRHMTPAAHDYQDHHKGDLVCIIG